MFHRLMALNPPAEFPATLCADTDCLIVCWLLLLTAAVAYNCAATAATVVDGVCLCGFKIVGGVIGDEGVDEFDVDWFVLLPPLLLFMFFVLY